MLENEANYALIAYKKLGETPLACLLRTRSERGIEPNIPMTYAGRLDPMAEGLLIILTGEECKNKEKYLNLDKIYEFQILVGFQTDTNDLLGLTEEGYEDFLSVSEPPERGLSREKYSYPDSVAKLTETFSQFIGTFSQRYPSFSSKTVGGKQLFQLALDDELPTEMPEHEVTIYDFKYKDSTMISKEELRKEIRSRINLVTGNFRQDEIIKKWEEVLDASDKKEFEILSLVCSCSSGTYIRQLVADIGEKVGMPLVTYSIKRTKVGEYVNEG